ncbi:MAG: 4Fe-4S binding protein [Candidatus Bathyarchaeia archaeon]
MGVDIFQMLSEDAKRRRRRRAELLKALGVKEYFSDGSIRINNKICQGIECKLCIKACPTNALYWSYGRVNIVEDICIYCAACVLSCIVDDCIKITRRRPDGRVETFSKPSEVVKLLNLISSRRRIELIGRVFQR